ncbi:hypothetical protein QFZ63_006373 [Streptomyces sp. B3I7]|nr:hypothetical protein [Streptomyces sp. B3I7]
MPLTGPDHRGAGACRAGTNAGGPAADHRGAGACRAGTNAGGPAPEYGYRGPAGGQRTLPYQTLLVHSFCSRTTSPVFGACQIFPLPA